MFLCCCWKSPSVAPDPVSHIQTIGMTDRQASGRSTTPVVLQATETVHTIAVSALPTSQRSSSHSSIIVTRKRTAKTAFPFENLSEGIHTLIASHFSFLDWIRSKKINHMFSRIFTDEVYFAVNTSSFHRIVCIIEDMHSLLVALNKKSRSKHRANGERLGLSILDINSSLSKKVNLFIDYVVKKYQVESNAIQKIEWFFWKLRNRFRGWNPLYTNELLKSVMPTRRYIEINEWIENRMFYESRDYVSLEKINWDLIDVRIVMSYAQERKNIVSCMKDLNSIGIFIDGIIEKCLDPMDSDKKFRETLFDSTYNEVGYYICQQIFRRLEQSKIISHEDLMRLFVPHQPAFELFCDKHFYSDDDLLFIRNRCPNLTKVILHAPSFSLGAIKKFCRHPNFPPVTNFEVLHGAIHLDAIASILRPKALLQFSILKVNVKDIATLKAINCNDFSIKCDWIVVEDAEATTEMIKDLIEGLQASKLSQNTDYLDISDTKATLETLKFVVSRRPSFKIRFHHCLDIDLSQIQKCDEFKNFFFDLDRCILSPLVNQSTSVDEPLDTIDWGDYKDEENCLKSWGGWELSIGEFE